jgi:hypothetical protein
LRCGRRRTIRYCFLFCLRVGDEERVGKEEREGGKRREMALLLPRAGKVLSVFAHSRSCVILVRVTLACRESSM